ncbi:MAG: GNAT family N-acetyltransferase, partial [Alphaproteobacteria bacterium]|nr:GNAT family N-acetyltransferase [Alphaproteobacteria bacterium]
LGKAGWLQRLGMQFHWHNEGYADFEQLLGALNSRKRKAIRRERRDAHASGLTFRTLQGAEITKREWDAFYRFYTSTVDRKWGSAYLTRAFFSLIGERLDTRVVLMLAEQDGKAVAGALNLAGRDTLYGRNWGCRGDWPFLHFELCYYQAIDWAIAHGLQRVEAGAQGRHKIQRGYVPCPTYSAHWIAHPALRRAIANFLDEERPAIRADIAMLAAQSPYRQDEEND